MKNLEPKHYVAISVHGIEELYQAVCNPIKCGWFGILTNDKSWAEFEREIHYIEILDSYNSK